MSENKVSNEHIYDVLIIGGGPAGLNAAIYSKRKGNDVAIVAMQVGGQMMNTGVVENYLGTINLSGPQLTDVFRKHVEDLEVPIMEYVAVEKLESKGKYHYLYLNDGQVLKTKVVIITIGGSPRKLGIKGEEEFAGLGVAYCAICDAPLFKGKDVIIAGGGNSAVEAAIDVSKICKSVTIVHRSQFRADEIMLNELKKRDNVKVYLQSPIQEIVGDDFVTGVIALDKESGETFEVKAEGIFVEIGHIPNTQMFEGIVELNKAREIVVDRKCRTNVPGIYAAGDITDNPYNQIITAASDGAIAALAANEYINSFDA